MAICKHPMTGVELNVIDIARTSLTHDEAVTAHVMKQKGESYHTIAQKLGINPARLGEVFKGKRHPGAMKDALAILTSA